MKFKLCSFKIVNSVGIRKNTTTAVESGAKSSCLCGSIYIGHAAQYLNGMSVNYSSSVKSLSTHSGIHRLHANTVLMRSWAIEQYW